MLNLFAKVPIFHIASMARSGETVFLRHLAAHPRIRVVHNLAARDAEHSARFFEYLKHYRGRSIRLRHPYVRPYGASAGDVLVLKQGVWEHQYPFDGIILARNPASIYASLRIYDREKTDDDLDQLWANNTRRFMRWMRSIQPDLETEFEGLSPVDQFCFFYNRRMGALAKLKLPLVRYEDFVEDSRGALSVAVEAMGLEFDEKMLQAHADYGRGSRGHGKIDMGAPVHRGSLYKFQQIITPAEFDAIAEKTAQVHRAFGYRMSWDSIEIEDAAEA
jgi:hypothetical protein